MPKLSFLLSALLISNIAAFGQWSDTGALQIGRETNPAVLLASGQLLVMGGIVANGYTATAELYNPSTGAWNQTGSMSAERFFHTATLLPDGRVLVTGGQNQSFGFLKSTEFFDPATGSWTPGPPLNIGRSSHSAALLPGGRVLVAGGNGPCLNGSGLDCVYHNAEIYDPVEGKWSLTGSMHIARYGAIATLLYTGKVLITSGSNAIAYDQYGIAQSELYDPATGTFSLTGTMTSARAGLTVNTLRSGMVLAAGGCGSMLSNCASAELYDPSTGVWTATGSLHTGRDYHASSMLPDGRVLIAGGENIHDPLGPNLASAETYDPATGVWTETASMNKTREQFTATLLTNGTVLVEGGAPTGAFGVPPLTSSELFIAAQ